MKGNEITDFKASSKSDWKNLARQELKTKSLKDFPWEISKDVFLEHYYTLEEVDLTLINKIQATQRSTANWLRAVQIHVVTPQEVIDHIKSSLDQKDICYWINISSNAFSITELADLLIANKLENITFYFVYNEFTKEIFLDTSPNIEGGIIFDPITNFFKHNNTESKISLENSDPKTSFKQLCIDGDYYHNRGAEPVQELGFILANLVQLVDQITDSGISPQHAFSQIIYSTSVGTQYITEIAKLRALRYLIYKVAAAYGIQEWNEEVFIHVNTSLLYQTSNVPHTNLVRGTTEAMSAILGGCNSLYVHPFDHDNQFTNRISSNISLLLSHESHFNIVADPAAGSYLIETATAKLVNAGWAYFLKIEAMGGIMTAYQNGFVEKELESSYQRKVANLDAGAVLIGVNQFNENTQPKPLTCHSQSPNLEQSYAAVLAGKK